MLGSLCFFVMMGQFLSASIPPMIVPIMMDLQVDSSQVSQLASWATLAVGLGVSLILSRVDLATYFLFRVPIDADFQVPF